VINRFGTEKQRTRFLPGIASGEPGFSVGLSEPGAGSDLKAIRTRAVPDGDGWVISITALLDVTDIQPACDYGLRATPPLTPTWAAAGRTAADSGRHSDTSTTPGGTSASPVNTRSANSSAGRNPPRMPLSL
jgi:hypothetical protein